MSERADFFAPEDEVNELALNFACRQLMELWDYPCPNECDGHGLTAQCDIATCPDEQKVSCLVGLMKAAAVVHHPDEVHSGSNLSVYRKIFDHIIKEYQQ